MYPEIFRIGPTPVYSYGLMLVISFALGMLIAQKRAKARGIPVEAILDVTTVILLSSIIGSRFLYVVFHVEEFRGHWIDTINVFKGLAGLSMFGGIVLAVLLSVLYMRRKRLPVWQISDAIAPSIALGLGITRIGCLLNGCCFGRPTDLPWGIAFPPGCVAWSVVGGAHIHPTQLYESLAGLLIFATALLIDRKRLGPGSVLCVVLGLYGVVRFLVDFVRFQEPSNYATFVGLSLTSSQLFSLCFIVAALIGLIVFNRKGWTVEAYQEKSETRGDTR
jgi:phosphatidylglycerol---prolipoprotein diacylglyceryl transferase